MFMHKLTGVTTDKRKGVEGSYPCSQPVWRVVCSEQTLPMLLLIPAWENTPALNSSAEHAGALIRRPKALGLGVSVRKSGWWRRCDLPALLSRGSTGSLHYSLCRHRARRTSSRPAKNQHKENISPMPSLPAGVTTPSAARGSSPGR